MIGPGKYDDVCRSARKMTNAKGIILIVVDGHKGSGCSVQLESEYTRYIPSILRAMANDMENDQKAWQ